MNKEVAQYINGLLLSDRERLMEERKDDTNQWQSMNCMCSNSSEWELSIIYQAQKSMDYIEEELICNVERGL